MTPSSSHRRPSSARSPRSSSEARSLRSLNDQGAPMSNDVIIVDEPVERVRRITMNRPEKRNSLVHPLRGALLETLRAHDQDPGVSVTIIRGAGPSFSAGYDL